MSVFGSGVSFDLGEGVVYVRLLRSFGIIKTTAKHPGLFDSYAHFGVALGSNVSRIKG